MIKLPQKSEKITALPFFGSNPDGNTISVNNKYLELDGTPLFPVSGEFHYSRYRACEWERELCKMKAGGITVVAAYVFWIHHEEKLGEWDFSGDRDLRRFITLCGKCGLHVLLRIGPWCHGECRNGGFPDYIQFQKNFKSRTNDETYLGHVKRLYGKIYEQVRGLLWKDGGPIIGVQLENEYRSYAEPNKDKRTAHMRELKKIAVECGFDVPLYTATAWGTATILEDGTLPVLGGYADAAWARTLDELPESANFLFTPPVNDASIGSDLKADPDNYAFDFDINRYPYFTAELGGGMQVTLHRRVVIDAKDTEALSVCKIGSGATLIGYYMYHGGTNPDGKLTTLEESAAVGAPNTLPVKSYDFQAPIGENGDLNESYHLLRRHHLLLKEWGELLATAVTVIPNDSATDPKDLQTPRYSVRHNAEHNCGFVFVNNHLRKRDLAEHDAVSFTLETATGTIITPPVNIKNHDTLILPYNLPMGKSTLTATNATPLCRIGKRWFFYTDAKPVYRFEDKEADIVTLTEAQSRRAYKLGNYLYIADCALYEKDGAIIAEYYRDTDILVYGETGGPKTTRLSAEPLSGGVTITDEGQGNYRVTLSYPDTDAEPMLNIDFAGDRFCVYDAGNPEHIFADRFATGLPDVLSLDALGKPTELIVRVFKSEQNRYFDLPVKCGCELTDARMTFRYTAVHRK